MEKTLNTIEKVAKVIFKEMIIITLAIYMIAADTIRFVWNRVKGLNKKEVDSHKVTWIDAD